MNRNKSFSFKNIFGGFIKKEVKAENPPDVSKTEHCRPAELSFPLRLAEYMDNDKNYVLSPLSLEYALAMTANGADEEVKAEILGLLNISDIEEYNKKSKKAKEALSSKVKDYGNFVSFEGKFISKEQFKETEKDLTAANSVWFVKDSEEKGDFSENFKAVMKDCYNAEASSVKRNDAAEIINRWCSKSTRGRINRIINRADFTAGLVNALYFKGRWKKEFAESKTEKDKFTNSDKTVTITDFMNGTKELPFYEDKDIKILSLPYEHGSKSMYLVLTERESIDILKYADKTEEKMVKVKIPKFKTETEIEAKNMMKAAGAEKMFKPGYHFKAMFNEEANKEDIFISNIIHKTCISVDEEGTEAAAVSAVLMELTACPPEDTEPKIYYFTADKPFTYFIKDNSTGDILFIGRFASAK